MPGISKIRSIFLPTEISGPANSPKNSPQKILPPCCGVEIGRLCCHKLAKSRERTIIFRLAYQLIFFQCPGANGLTNSGVVEPTLQDTASNLFECEDCGCYVNGPTLSSAGRILSRFCRCCCYAVASWSRMRCPFLLAARWVCFVGKRRFLSHECLCAVPSLCRMAAD